MKVRNTVKKIAALAAGTSMIAATISGATALDLSDYPAPFVENGVGNFKIVIGQSGVAQVSDVLGAIDIATSLQTAAVTPVGTSGTSSTVSVTGGVEIKTSSDDLNFNETLNGSLSGGRIDHDDFPDLLADGVLEDDDGAEYDYEQEIILGDARVELGRDDDYGDDPVLNVDLDGASNKNIQFDIDFDSSVNVVTLTDSESITMFGKQFTFDPNHTADGDMTIYGSDVIVTVNQDEPVTVEVAGEEYTLNVLGGNSDNSEVILQVTGSSTSTKTLKSGDSRTMAGLELFIDDVFISNIGASSVAASVFVGSDKIVIDSSSVGTTESYGEIELNGEDDTDIEAWVEGANLTAVDKIHFRIDPTDFNNPDTDEDWEWLVEGAEFVEPLFGFSLSFESYTPSLDDRHVFEVVRSGDEYHLNFENNDGDAIDLELYKSSGSTVTLGDNLDIGSTSLVDGDIFILEEDSNNREDAITKVYEVRDIEGASGDEKVTLKDVGSGTTKAFDLNDEIDDTGVTISAVDVGDAHFNISSATLDYIVFRGGMNMTLDSNFTDSAANITMSEDADDLDDVSSVATFSFQIGDGSASFINDNDEDIGMTNIAITPGVTQTDDGSDTRFGITLYGTWVEQEIENSGSSLKFFYSEEETDFHVFVNGPDAVVVTTGGTSGSTAYQLNEFVVGQIAVYDNEAMSLLGSTPLIVVGGPCVNTVAMDLMGNPEECAEGFSQGKGMIKFFDDQSALLVAGYSGDDTIGASYVLADYSSYMADLTGDEVEVITTDLQNLEVNPLS